MMIRQAGAREVHMRVSSPPPIEPCYYGIDTPTTKEYIANKYNIEGIRKYIDADSLKYLSYEGMLSRRIRTIRKCYHFDVRLYETELSDNIDEEKRIELIKNAMFSIGKLPFKLQLKLWREHILFRSSGKTMDSVVDAWVYLRDIDSAKLITKYASAENIAIFGRLHKLSDLYKKNSGFSVIGININDDLSCTLDSANIDAVPSDIADIVGRNLSAIRSAQTLYNAAIPHKS
jgi:hypothetical protein